ncbi:MAG: response regulator [Pseudomonadota bacterium]
MASENVLKGKKILIVDDEPDVLATLEELLAICDVKKAHSFEEAVEQLESEYFDIAILDIMGVNGYRLLEIAKEIGVIPVMLTAHALSIDDTIKSYKEGAAYYVPKEKMTHIITYLNDILEAKSKGKSLWWRWFERFGAFYSRQFGNEWKDKDKEFWDMFPY